MADKKISQLTAATTPLAGTEVLPIVQSSTTVKVAVSDLTAGRAVSAGSLALTTALPVTSGGTGTGTAFTLGSVVFAGVSGNYTQNNAKFLWDNTNNRLGIGTATPAYALDVTGDVRVTSTMGVGVTPSAGITVYARAGTTGTPFYADNGSNSGFTVKFASGTTSVGNDFNGPLIFLTNNADVGRFDTSGNLLVGTTNSSASAGVGVKILPGGRVFSVTDATSDTYNYYSTTAAAYRFYVTSAGTVFATNTTISAISDARLKENVRDLDDGLNVILALKPRKFDWKENKGPNTKNARGFIAQEFEQVLPDLIDEWKDPAPEGEPPYKSVRPDLIPVLVKAIQELEARLAVLEAK